MASTLLTVLMNKRIASMVTIATIALTGMAAVNAHGEENHGKARWQSTTVTVSGLSQDEVASLNSAWKTITLVASPDGEITVNRGTDLDKGVGGEARRTMWKGYIVGCEINLVVDTLPVLTHEVGHCFGMSHLHKGASNMHWFAEDYKGGWSDTVTDEDRARLAAIYYR